MMPEGREKKGFSALNSSDWERTKQTEFYIL